MERKRMIVIAVMLLLSIVNYNRLTNNDAIRPIQFISIFAIGALSGLLLYEIATRLKAKQQ